jgi:hypothetical protein
MSDFLSWVSSRLADGAVVVILLGIAGFLARSWLKERLIASIRLQTEKQLARVNAEIRAGESQISSVTSAGITAIGQMAEATLPASVTAVQASAANRLGPLTALHSGECKWQLIPILRSRTAPIQRPFRPFPPAGGP